MTERTRAKEPTARPDPVWDRSPWSNWAGDVVIERPDRVFRPTTRQELVDIVRAASLHRPAQRVRACGSHWALSDIAVSPNWFVETTGLRSTLHDVVPAALTDEARTRLTHQAADGAAFTYVHVQSGVTISDLNLRLDRLPGIDGSEPGPLTTDELLAGTPLAGLRWALPTMGGACGQTLAGAISTATHGGDHRLPPLADAVQAIHLVTTAGRELWIERDDPLTDTDRLGRVLPDVTVHRSTELFDAALVSLGRMGVVYSLVLRVVQQFSLEQRIAPSTWDAERAGLCQPFPVFDATSPQGGTAEPSVFVEVVMPTYARPDGTRTCYVTHRWRGPDAFRPPPPRRDLFGLVCGQRSIRPVLVTLLVLVVAVIGLLLALTGPGVAVLTVGALGGLALVVLVVRYGHLTLGEVVRAVCDAANRHGKGRLIRAATRAAVASQRKPGLTRSVGYEIMDLGRAGNICYKADSVEVAFDASSGAHVKFLTDDLFPIFDRSAQAGRSLGGYVSLRFTGRSAAMLAMQRWDHTCSIEVSLLLGVDGNQDVLEAIQDAAVARGGTVSWGQRNRLDRAQIERAFPSLDDWRTQLGRVVGDDLTFSNDFCARRGLEPEPTSHARRTP
jgi:hypothetical protein